MPKRNSVWFDPLVDTYITEAELARIGLRRFLEGNGTASSLLWPLVAGAPDERGAALREFQAWKSAFELGETEDCEEWVQLVPYLAGNEPSLEHLLPSYQSGSLEDVMHDLDTVRFLSASRNAQFAADLSRYLESKIPRIGETIDDVEPVCNLIAAVASEINFAGCDEHLNALAKLAEPWWRSARNRAETDHPLLSCSWTLLEWCWRFKWHFLLETMWKDQVFANDCIVCMINPKNIAFPALFSKYLAENLLALSLTPSAQVLKGFNLSDDLLKAHVEYCISLAERTDATRVTYQEQIIREVGSGERLWPDSAMYEDIARMYGLPDNEDSLNIVAAAWAPCVELSRLKLALAIVGSRNSSDQS
jgi:hypothetical protein